ncbi:hypothetical protein [Aneurinibacillus terranovensis]|uniref:hypothetical protein n=1 Tax=Aneurinibacillus terranovensis TaxID=278991 RepID=UPI000420F7A0|nr:hypothetical protein [Aneurinibacillus terranovensis]
MKNVLQQIALDHLNIYLVVGRKETEVAVDTGKVDFLMYNREMKQLLEKRGGKGGICGTGRRMTGDSGRASYRRRWLISME